MGSCYIVRILLHVDTLHGMNLEVGGFTMEVFTFIRKTLTDRTQRLVNDWLPT